jgi:two-component system, NarL family, nitrate/nitrite response regulator NarL
MALQREPVQTIAICDTEPIAIEGLRSILESAEGLRVVAAETCLTEGFNAVRECKPSVLLLDRSFGIHAVMDLLKSLREYFIPTAVIVWSANFSGTEALRFLQAGASGVIRKTAALETLMRCIQSVVAGNTWMEEDMLRETGGPIRQMRSPLTSREMQVMELVERGMKNKDIATVLGIRTGTVKIHLKHIFEKTGIRGRYGLALSGLKEKGLLTVPLSDTI